MRARRIAVATAAMFVAGGAALALVLGGGGGEAGGGDPASRLLEPARFAAEIAKPRVVTVNVHVPDEGSIPGTDLAIPYDRIEARRAELPPGSTPLAIYCRSGRMSAIAARTLAALGYARISELAGGMEAWQESGRRLLPPLIAG